MAGENTLKTFGKATVDIFRRLVAPQVGKEAMCQALGYIENAGGPQALAPDFVGQKLYDTTNKVFYRAVDTTVGAWIAMARGIGNAGANATKSATAVLTIAEMLTGQIIANAATGAGVTYTTDIATAIDTALVAIYPDLKTNDYIDFSVCNVSAVTAEIVTVAGGTGVTPKGDMTVAPVLAGDTSSGIFRLQKTGAGAYDLIRRS